MHKLKQRFIDGFRNVKAPLTTEAFRAEKYSHSHHQLPQLDSQQILNVNETLVVPEVTHLHYVSLAWQGSRGLDTELLLGVVYMEL